MRRFARLLNDLEPLLEGAARQRRLQAYLAGCTDPADAAWSVALLTGARPARLLSPAALRQVGPTLCRLDPWLFDSCLQAAGGRLADVPEVVALALPRAETAGRADDGDPGAQSPERTLPEDPGLADLLGESWARWRRLTPDGLSQALHATLQPLDADARRLLLLLATGAWRTPVRRPLLQAAVAGLSGLELALVAERLRGCDTDPPSAAAWARWTAAAPAGPQPAPRGLAPHAFVAWTTAASPDTPVNPDTLEALAALAATTVAVQLLPAGQRVQWVCRHGESELWTADALPLARKHRSHVERLQAGLLGRLAAVDGRDPGACSLVLEGILPDDGSELVIIDALEIGGTSLTMLPWAERMARWQALVPDVAAAATAAAVRETAADAAAVASATAPAWRLPETVPGAFAATDLKALHAGCRSRGAAGLLLRAQDGVSRPDAAVHWWPAAAWSLQVLVLYAHAGGSGGPGMQTTLAVWCDGQADASGAARPDASAVAAVTESLRHGTPPPPGSWQLVPLARVTLAPGDAMLPLLDAWLREAALQRFGPVRSLRPGLVLELAFDAVAGSRRHRSGVVVRGARLLRVCPDRLPWQAATLADVQALVTR